jgi:hypothetical protein
MRVELNHFKNGALNQKLIDFQNRKNMFFFVFQTKQKNMFFFYKIPCRERKDEIFSWKNEWIEKKELEFEEMKIMGKWV